MRSKIILVFAILFSFLLACGTSSRSTESTADERVMEEIPTLTNTPAPTDTLTPQPSDTPTSLPVPTDTPSPNQVTESDVGLQEDGQADQPPDTEEASLISGSSIVIITVDKDAEFVDIQNVNNEPIDLSGWRLLSEKGEQNCNLGGVIQPNEILRIWALADDADQFGFNCGFDGNIWNNSELDPAVIFDSNGVEVYRVDCKNKVCQ